MTGAVVEGPLSRRGSNQPSEERRPGGLPTPARNNCVWRSHDEGSCHYSATLQKLRVSNIPVKRFPQQTMGFCTNFRAENVGAFAGDLKGDLLGDLEGRKRESTSSARAPDRAVPGAIDAKYATAPASWIMPSWEMRSYGSSTSGCTTWTAF